MGKYAKYERHYCPDWEKEAVFKDWIQKVPADNTKAYCKFCRCEVRAHRGDLNAHKATEKHKRYATPHSSMRTLFDVGCSQKIVDNTVKSIELRLALHIACHSSVLTVDQLGELVRDFCSKDVAI